MRDARRQQAPAMAAMAVLLAVGVATLLNAPPALGHGFDIPGPPRTPFTLPPSGMDADGDGWHDQVDAMDGNMVAAVRVAHGGGRDLVFLVSTDDDQHRTGAGMPLEWPHLVDMDPLDPTPGSEAWREANVRTGTTVRAAPRPAGEAILVLDVADDRLPKIDVEVWDGADHVRLAAGTVSPRSGQSVSIQWTSGQGEGEGWLLAGPDAATALQVARRWAPTLRFDSEESVFPVAGSALAAVDGFYPVQPDLRPWARTFNNGHDGYRLLLDHYNDDGLLDHRDVAARLEGLAALEFHRPVVHAHVAWSQDLQVVVQYWFLYPYNYVLDSQGRDIEGLAHNGDRELVQLTFKDMDAAQTGAPLTVAFSQHYRGVVLPWDAPDRTGEAWDVYVARGSHASYPLAGDDRRATPALMGYHDRFDGRGVVWSPAGYDIELLDDDGWFLQGLWSPLTRSSRDLGIPSAATFRYDFRYPFVEPHYWQDDLPELNWDVADRLYGGGS